MRLRTPKSVTYLTACLTVSSAWLMIAPEGLVAPAQAACSPTTLDLTPTNRSVICDGATINQNTVHGYGIGTQDNLVITVNPGASVTGDLSGFFLDENIALTNNGTIRGTNEDGFYADGSVSRLENNGRIEAGRIGAYLNGGVVFLQNDGTIESGQVTNFGHGIFVNGTAQELLNTGIVRAGLNTSGAAGIYVSNGTMELLRNDGTVQAGNDGILTNLANIESLINTGLIDAGRHGVYAFRGDIVSLQNFGTIRSVGQGLRTVDGQIQRVINAGLIDGGDHGVYSENDRIVFLSNTGTIYGQTNAAVRAALMIDRLENSGRLEGATNGVSGNGGIDWLSNTGHITGLAGAAVTTSTGSIGTVVNSGRLFGTVDGIYAINDIGTLTNSGFIGSDFIGVRALNGRIGSLTNSGTIQGVSFAVQEGGAGDTTLTLNAGSILVGRVDLGGGTNTLHVGQGLSLNSTFEANGGATEVSIGTLHGHLAAVIPVAGNGNNDVQVVAVDPAAFASFDDALTALTSGIGQSVQSRQTALRSDSGFSFAAIEESRLAAFSNFDDRPATNPNRFWIEGFGAYRHDQSDRTGSNFDHLTGGMVAGVDVPVDAITRVGVMAGFAAGRSQNETGTQETDTMSYYAGVYASTEALGLAWDTSLTVGYTDYDQERVTANNLIANGLETASADFGGWFVNPQVTVTNSTPTGFSPTDTALLGFALPTIEQSLTLAYAGLFVDGYTETGTTNPLTLDDRAIHIASARAALALPFQAAHTGGAATTLRLIGGIEARTRFGDDAISGTLLGQSVTTALDDKDVTLSAFLGLSGEYQTTSALTAYANAEILLENNASYRLSATAGLRIAF
jgi:hypothetical protein